MKQPIIIAIDGTSASGKSTNAKLVARALGYVYVDTGSMYRTLAWYCLKSRIDAHDAKAVTAACRKWKTSLVCVDARVRLLVNGYYPEKEVRTAETSAAASAHRIDFIDKNDAGGCLLCIGVGIFLACCS